MAPVAAARGGGAEILSEDHRQGVYVGKVEERERGDGDVELGGIDAAAEDAGARSALEQVGEDGEQRDMHVSDAPGAPQVFRAIQVLADEKRDEFSVVVTVADAELDEATHALAGRQAADV